MHQQGELASSSASTGGKWEYYGLRCASRAHRPTPSSCPLGFTAPAPPGSCGALARPADGLVSPGWDMMETEAARVNATPGDTQGMGGRGGGQHTGPLQQLRVWEEGDSRSSRGATKPAPRWVSLFQREPWGSPELSPNLDKSAPRARLVPSGQCTEGPRCFTIT